MKFEFNGFGIEVTKEDLIELFECLKNPIKKTFKVVKDSLPQKYSICLVDNRYKRAKYIIEYGKIKTSMKNFKITLSTFQVAPNKICQSILLEDIFTDKELIESSGELSGFELDTPEIESFDIILNTEHLG